MAQSASDEARSSSQAASADPNSRGASDATSAAAVASGPKKSSHSTGGAFQAINRTSESPAAAGSRSDDATGVKTSRNEAAAVKAERTQSPSTGAPSKATSQGETADATMAESSYGTRSRNRTSARPNYSEEQEMDFEYTTPPATTTTTSSRKKTNDASHTGATESKRGHETTNGNSHHHSNNSNHGGGGGAAASATGKDAASSTLAGNPGNPISKKRKAAAATSSSQSAAAASTTKSVAGAASATARETNLMTFFKHKQCLNKKGELVADDGTRLSANDHVYLVCEPPGDPYYLCRIMEFLHVDANDPTSPVDSLRVNWYYRPRDVQRFSSDTRLVFGTMHSDMCPITSLRGKCTIKHRSEIDDLDAYRRERDSFYFVQAFDRFIRRSYEIIPVQQIINVPDRVKKALNERWKFVVVEAGRVKELTSAAKTCKRCARYCASNDSVDCAICKNSYHMNCVQPPLPKKPSRGFAWACGPCSRASEMRMEARNTPTLGSNEGEDEEVVEEEEQPEPSNQTTRAPSPDVDDMLLDEHPPTEAEIAMAKMWPMRYLGIHARLEDALQYDDRAIYPRASSRLGPRHQATTLPWFGRPVELVKPIDVKRKYNKGGAQKYQGKPSKETLAAMEAEREERAKRPKWVQDEPAGYIPRGEDYDNDDPRCTAKLIFKMPSEQESSAKADAPSPEKLVDDYLTRARPLSKAIGVPPFGINFLDKSLELLYANKYDIEPALEQLKKVNRQKDLHEPVISRSDLIKFEEGVAKYGSEHRLIRLHMKSTLPHADIVRFYYLWKKTPKGREIWGNYGGRKKRKIESDAGAKLQAEIAHDVDDSAFDNDKAAKKGRGFQCKFCNTVHSRQWRRAPGVSPGQMAPPDTKGPNKDKKDRPLLALCLRCAGLWRKYAIQWEDIDDVKKLTSGSGKGVKRRVDEELLRELVAANEAASAANQEALAQAHEASEPARKKTKMEKESASGSLEPSTKKKEKLAPPPKEPTPPPPPIVPTQPIWRDLPCAVCRAVGDTVACQHCKLTVHRRCFGLRESEGVKADGDVKWVCDQCQNDRNPVVSTEYACCLCLTEETQIDLVETPRSTHKKKNDRDREKERMEKELADAMRADYRARQLAQNRPPGPREPLKCTTGNNWVHVYCAVWAPEIRFSNAKALQVAEGFQLIPPARFEAVCKLCKNKDHQNRVRENAGACINCFQCNASFHASCAFEAGYQFGFDVQPVKGSRKDQVTTATLGQETGSLTAVVLCKDHIAKTIVHPVNEVVDDAGTTALQVFVENYKQADLTLTGTVRKAQLAQQTKDKGQQSAVNAQLASRRESTAHSIAAAVRRGARSSMAETKMEIDDGPNEAQEAAEIADRRCVTCDVDVTPRWYSVTLPLPTAPIKRSNSKPGPGEAIDAAMETNAPAVAQPKQQNIRFMAPGASGRAWEGMPDRHAARSTGNGDRNSAEASSAIPANEVHTAPGTGEYRLPFEELRREIEEDRHQHPPSQPQRATSRPPMPQPAPPAAKPELSTAWMCHKCFLKGKLVPTPPPEDRIEPRKHETERSPVQATIASIEQQFRPWDEPPPLPPQAAMPRQPIPSLRNGAGPVPGYMPGYGAPPPGPPPHHAYQPPPQHFGPPNGYLTSPPPHMSMPPGGPPPPMHERPLHDRPLHERHGHERSMHERHGSYGYQHPSPTQSYGLPLHETRPGLPHHDNRPPHYAHPPPMPNGHHAARGPHPPHANMHSPSYPTAPVPHPPGQPMRSEPPFQPHLSPIGAPAYSRPDTHYGQPRPEAQAPPPLHPNQPPLPIDPSLMNQTGAPPGPMAPTSHGHHGPEYSGLPHHSPIPPPVTPRNTHPGAPGTSGASNSPSLANLLS